MSYTALNATVTPEPVAGCKSPLKGLSNLGCTEQFISKGCFAPWLPPEGSAGTVLSTAPGVSELANLKWFCHRKV